MDGLVDARPALGEEVLDGADRCVDLYLQPGLLGDLAQGGLLDALGVIGRSLGKRPAGAVALATSSPEADLESRVRFANDDPAT